ncbi:MAG: ribosomal-protein-alanine N-acetyltransferase [Ruminococcaceae bacterium]|nr:ribosomal-protein-alanine N-acetyltransferase [Oscillospiraceae bacterium]
MSELLIRKMAEADVPAVAELEKLCFSMPWSENAIRSELENNLSLWLVAEHDGAVCGYVGSQTVLDESDVMNIAVSESARGKGIAGNLMRELMRNLCDIGSEKLTLEVRVSNLPARGLYAKLGFQQVGVRKNYYRDPREDALILSISLKEGNV